MKSQNKIDAVFLLLSQYKTVFFLIVFSSSTTAPTPKSQRVQEKNLPSCLSNLNTCSIKAQSSLYGHDNSPGHVLGLQCCHGPSLHSSVTHHTSCPHCHIHGSVKQTAVPRHDGLEHILKPGEKLCAHSALWPPILRQPSRLLGRDYLVRIWTSSLTTRTVCPTTYTTLPTHLVTDHMYSS